MKWSFLKILKNIQLKNFFFLKFWKIWELRREQLSELRIFKSNLNIEVLETFWTYLKVAFLFILYADFVQFQ